MASPVNGDDTSSPNAMIVSTMKGISMVLVLCWILSGLTILAIHSINNIFAILLPSMFPIAKSVVPCSDEVILTTSSGAEVPNATIVSPTIISDTPNFLAIVLAQSTRKSAPLISSINQIMSSTMVRII